MPKTRTFQQIDPSGRDLGDHAWIWCPGCKANHSLRFRMPSNPTPQEIEDQRMNRHGLWSFNGDYEKPTFSPSLLVFANDPDIRCHSFIRDGKIEFLMDSFHELKGQTVELPDCDL